MATEKVDGMAEEDQEKTYSFQQKEMMGQGVAEEQQISELAQMISPTESWLQLVAQEQLISVQEPPAAIYMEGK